MKRAEMGDTGKDALAGGGGLLSTSTAPTQAPLEVADSLRGGSRSWHACPPGRGHVHGWVRGGGSGLLRRCPTSPALCGYCIPGDAQAVMLCKVLGRHRCSQFVPPAATSSPVHPRRGLKGRRRAAAPFRSSVASAPCGPGQLATESSRLRKAQALYLSLCNSETPVRRPCSIWPTPRGKIKVSGRFGGKYGWPGLIQCLRMLAGARVLPGQVT